ncbi:sulfatase [Actinomadura rayongensis]|uniref:Sulfatase-like hydrolase/transferase n=1 Tax=Actinomadura rayongensis TaxID=1429076 RepID=A0A6I4WGF9_9ACTN|nr:sulfatase [Actinomadura rayongensis]MXQ67425.1 sulfatase-like hydrolase/transferase [Actinomadura rayongensis]
MSARLSRHALGALTVPLALTFLGAASGPAPAAAAKEKQPGRPNVVFVLADDLGWADLSTGRTNQGNGNDFIQTPAIDRLAREGMSFDNGYACVMCAPSRSALLTGLYAQRPDNNIYLGAELNSGGDDTLLVGPPQGLADGNPVLPPHAVTVAETLQSAGYRTGYIGKFHVTKNAAEIVSAHGFDENFGGSESGNAKVYHAENGKFDASIGPALNAFAAPYTQAYVDQNLKPYAHGVSGKALDALVGTQKHVTDALSDAAVNFIDRNSGRPFFTWLSQYAVHSPVGDAQARSDLLAKYKAATPGKDPAKPSYAALVEGLDQSVARVIDHLDRTPDPRNPGHVLADNTLVVFSSDNGGRTDLGGYNGPLKGQKGELDEGGVRVPWIVWSKNKRLVRGGTINSSPINGTDLYPTLAAYAGAKLPSGVPFDGTNLRPAFTTGAPVVRPRFAHLPGYKNGGARDQRPETTVRDGRWKLGYTYEDQRWHLYDLGNDIGETNDLASRRPDVVARLGTEIVRWLDRTDAPLATLRAGRPPLELQVRGTTYSAKTVRHYARSTTLRVQPGDEVPLVLPNS